jgi:DNA adenine methylase
MKAPFPWFGGKSKVAGLVWERFGNVNNYVEPFFGSGAVLLGRPRLFGTETVNDKDCYLANFWRAVQSAPRDVAYWASWPVNEADLQARHLWLVNQVEFRQRVLDNPHYYDTQVAGWWVWGLCQWIGGAWCDQNRPMDDVLQQQHRPPRRMPRPFSPGVWLRGHYNVYDYFEALAQRLRNVRVLCGDWSRVLGPSQTTALGLTGVLLDPPYSIRRCEEAVYGQEDRDVAPQVRDWAYGHGWNPMLRIALCGYEDEHQMPADWTQVVWDHPMGYSERTGGDRKHEAIWFSPHCLQAIQMSAFDEMA